MPITTSTPEQASVLDWLMQWQQSTATAQRLNALPQTPQIADAKRAVATWQNTLSQANAYIDVAIQNGIDSGQWNGDTLGRTAAEFVAGAISGSALSGGPGLSGLGIAVIDDVLLLVFAIGLLAVLVEAVFHSLVADAKVIGRSIVVAAGNAASNPLSYGVLILLGLGLWLYFGRKA